MRMCGQVSYLEDLLLRGLGSEFFVTLSHVNHEAQESALRLVAELLRLVARLRNNL